MKDAKGHGSNPRGWVGSGPANGDPRREAAATRFIPGHGVAPRSQVVAQHANTPSVGTGTLADVSAKGATTFGGARNPRTDAKGSGRG